MKVKDIIEEVCVLLNLNDVLSLEEFAQSQFKPTSQIVVPNEQTAQNLKVLTKTVNLALSKIAHNFVDLKHTQNFTTTNGKILISSFEKDPIEIVKIENKLGDDVEFKTFPQLVDVLKGGEYKITYLYNPGKLELNDTISDLSFKIKQHTIAYLVASIYCQINSMPNEAQTWEEKFNSQIKQKFNKRELKIKERRWF